MPTTRISLTPARREALAEALERFYLGEFDEELSPFRVQALIDFFVEELGPPVYNQGIHDAVAYVQDKLVDIEGDVLLPDTPR
jgi:uncharacterized protein (DUF2164 family)